MLKLRSLRSVIYKEIPFRNPYLYSESGAPLFKTQKISKEEMNQLTCQVMHCMKSRLVKTTENDNLFEIFESRLDSLCLAQKFFECRAHSYLKSKGLFLENWSESIIDGRKGDIPMLHGLNMLTVAHTILHLKMVGFGLLYRIYNQDINFN